MHPMRVPLNLNSALQTSKKVLARGAGAQVPRTCRFSSIRCIGPLPTGAG